MKVSFDGKWYDINTEEEALRAAIHARSLRVIEKSVDEALNVPGGYSMDYLRNALAALLDGTTLIAVKLGATAGLHHAYDAAVDYTLVDTYAHVINRLVGLNYTPPDKVITQEQDSGTKEQADEG